MLAKPKIIDEIIYTHEEIVEKTKEVARKLNIVYKDKEVVLISVLSGALPFTMELMKHLEFIVYLDYVSSQSYEYDKKVNEPQIKYDNRISLEGKDVLLIDEIIDSGKTIEKIAKLISGFEPNSVAVAALIVKSNRSKSDLNEYYGFLLEKDYFLVGYGLD